MKELIVNYNKRNACFYECRALIFTLILVKKETSTARFQASGVCACHSLTGITVPHYLTAFSPGNAFHAKGL